MPDVEALADQIRSSADRYAVAATMGDAGFLRAQKAKADFDAALDGLVEAAGKAEAGRASAAPTSRPGEAGVGAEDTAADFRTLWNNQELWEPEAVGALGRIEQRVAALVEAVRQRDAAVIALGRAAAFYADFEESGQSDWSIAMGACRTVYGRIPMVNEGGDPDCYRFPALLLSHRGEPG